MSQESTTLQKIVSLAKRRGFVYQSSEIYGGLRSSYDYGPMGVELKRNLMNEWWRAMVHSREDVVGLDASIVMHPQVWQASGHLASFSDPLVDCKVCGERFRADKAPRLSPFRPRLPGRAERALGTDPFNPDTDGDSTNDGADDFPLDPTRDTAPSSNPSDTTPPTITLDEPTNATLVSSSP